MTDYAVKIIDDDKFAAWFVVFATLALVLFGTFLLLNTETVAKNYYNYLSIMGILIIGYAIYSYIDPEEVSTNVGNLPNAVFGLIVSLGIGGAIVLGALANKNTSILLSTLSLANDTTNIFFVNFVAPIIEEFFFRGLILLGIYKITLHIKPGNVLLAIGTAIVFSSYLFAVWHAFAYEKANIYESFLSIKQGPLLFGVLAAGLTILLRSTLYGVGLHFANNLGASVFSGLIQRPELIANEVGFAIGMLLLIGLSWKIGGEGPRDSNN